MEIVLRILKKLHEVVEDRIKHLFMIKIMFDFYTKYFTIHFNVFNVESFNYFSKVFKKKFHGKNVVL